MRAASRLLAVAAAAIATATAVGLVAGEGAGATATRTYVAVADGYVALGGAAAGSGHTALLRVDAAAATRSYLRFHVHGLPGTIRRASLHVFSEDGARGGFAVRRVAANGWAESTLSARNAPALMPPAGVASGPVKNSSWVTIDVTRLVSSQGFVNLALLARNGSALRLSSRETGSRAPRLVVEANRAPTAAADTSATDEDAALTLPPAALLRRRPRP